MLENFSKRIEENQHDQYENLRHHIDATVGQVDSKEQRITQMTQKESIDSHDRFVTEIEAAKKLNPTLNFDISHDDSLDAPRVRATRCKARGQTQLS